MQSAYRLGLLVSGIAVVLAYKALTIAAVAPVPVLLAAVLEVSLLGLVWVVSASLEKSGVRLLRALSAALFYPVFYVVVVCSLAHTYFFESAAARHFSLFEVDLRTLVFFFTTVLPLRGTALLTALLVGMHLLAPAAGRWVGPVRIKPVALTVLAGAIVLAAALPRAPRVPSPIADMAADVWEQVTSPQVVVDPRAPARFAPKVLDKSHVKSPPHEPAFDKVLVFVMETMNSDVLERERTALPASSFVNRAQRGAHMYTRYYATNQDSRTGMLSMLGSRFIPYEAYTEEGRDHYLHLGQKSSLVDRFKELGYRTAFAVSQRELELVVRDLAWDERLHLTDEERKQAEAQKLLCFVPYEFEHSCEDRALLPRVLDFIDRNPKAFVYQEFIWGHAIEYNDASGRTNTDYYSTYVDAVLAHLEKTGQLDRTLVVLTSDHGFREKDRQSDLSVYQIPLFFWSPRYQERRDARLYSHLDFKDLLMHELIPGTPMPPENPFVMAVGPTGTSFLAALTQSGQFMLMKAQKGRAYLLHRDGPGENLPTLEDPAAFLRLFDDYLAYFESQRPR